MVVSDRQALVEDVHELVARMPHVTVEHGRPGNPVYQVGGKSFVFFRTRRPDAVDPDTGERYPDVIVFWVPSEADKQAMVRDPDSPFFTTPHFDGHPSVLVRASPARRAHADRTHRDHPGRLAVQGITNPGQGLARDPAGLRSSAADQSPRKAL